MRTIRVGRSPSGVGADVRAALYSMGRDGTASDGFALIGPQPHGCPKPVDAIVCSPRGVVIVAGVDLPGPALTLDAPLAGPWIADGWPLPADSDDATENPSDGALALAARAADAVTTATGIADIRTILAVGPYIGQVTQPDADRLSGVAVVHPEPQSLLTVLRELTESTQPCPAGAAARLAETLAPSAAPSKAELVSAGFPDIASNVPVDPAATAELPRIRNVDPAGWPVGGWAKQPAAHGPGSGRPHQLDHGTHTSSPIVPVRPRRWLTVSGRLRWTPLRVFGAGSLAFVILVVVLVITAPSDSPQQAAARSTPIRDAGLTVSGHHFTPEATVRDPDCAAHAFGDVQAFLAEHGCSGLTRQAFVTTVGGKRAAVSVADIRFPSSADARAFVGVATVAGSGGIDPIATDGTPWPGAPKSFSGAAYTSSVNGSRARLTAAVWIGAPSASTDTGLRHLATQALRLPPA